MPITTGQIIARGLLHRCPNCGGGTLLRPVFRVHQRCARCGLNFEREDGFFLGALVVNYTVTAVLMLFPLLIAVFMQRISTTTALITGGVWCVLFPLAFLPTAKSLWMMTYYLFVRDDLPAHRSTTRKGQGP